jgi:DNA polymerase elongation subunit (family B)
MQFKPWEIFYSTRNNELILWLCGRSSEGKRVKLPVFETEPYFYVPAGELPGHAVGHTMIKRIEPTEMVTLRGEPVDRVTTFFPYQVRDVRGIWSMTYEADVLYDIRMRIDHGIKNVIEVPDDAKVLLPSDIKPVMAPPLIPPRVVCIDIEVMDKKGYATPATAEAPVVSIALWDSFTDRYVVLLNGRLTEVEINHAVNEFAKQGWKVQIKDHADERELFASFAKLMDAIQPDVVTGWNLVSMGSHKSRYYTDGYDVPYLTNRAKNQSFQSPSWDEICCFDLLAAYKRLRENESESNTLDFVAKSIGLPGKQRKGDMKTWQMYAEDKAALLIYNVWDVWNTKEIDKHFNLVRFFSEIVAFAGTGLEGAIEEMKRIDPYVFHRLKPEGRVQPTRVHHDEAEWGMIEGAVVFETQLGTFDGVIEIDNTGEYANVMRTFNLSPETKRSNCDCGGRDCFILPSGRHYTKLERGIFPKIIDELIELRKIKKQEGNKEEERVVKEFTLSYYGLLAGRYYRNSDNEIGADITDVSRRHLQWNREFVEKEGGRIIMGDTDSCLFTVEAKGDIEQFAQGLVGRLNDALPGFAAQWGAEKCHLGVKVEHVYDRFLSVKAKTQDRAAKKRYACIYKDPAGEYTGKNGAKYSMKVKGFEIRRSNIAKITRDLQKEMIEHILFGENAKEEVRKAFDRTIKQMKAGQIDSRDYRKPQGWRQDKYTSEPIQVRAAKWSNQHIGTQFRVGDKPSMHYGYVQGKPKTDVFAVEWDAPLPKGAVIDMETTIEKTLVEPLGPILEAVDIHIQEILSPMVPLDFSF